MKKELNHSEVWAIAGGALHDEEYRTKYSEVLAFLLRDKNLKIIDTAGGTGFPTLDLYKLGFTNLSVTDGNETYAKELQEKFKKEGMNIQTLHSSWQEIGTKVSDKYDAIVNADNSFKHCLGCESELKVSGRFRSIEETKTILEAELATRTEET
jgi:hypothetical protein